MDTSKHMKGGEGEDSGMRQPTGGRKGRNKQSQNDHQDGGNDPLKMGGEGDVPKAGGSGDKYMSGGKCMKDGVEVQMEPGTDETGNSIMKCPAGSTEVPDGGRRRRRKSRKARKSRKSRKGRKSRKH